MAEPLTTPYGHGPDSLNSPVPDENANFLNQLSQIRVPQGPNAPSLVPQNQPQFVTPPSDPDASLNKVDPLDEAFAKADALDAQFAAVDAGQSGQAPEAEAPTVEKPSFAEMSGELGVLPALSRSVNDSINRFKLSFAKTNWEKAQFLSQMYGEENVRVKNGNVEFRRKGDKGFRLLDPETTEYIDDALDFSRDAYEMAAEALIRGGIGVGTAAVATPPVGVGAAMLSGAAGSTGALLAGEAQARQFGIPQDPTRNMAKELALAGGVGAVFGGIGAKFAAWRKAKDALKPSEATAEAALKTASELEQMSDELAASGIKLKNGKMTLSPGQMSSDYAPEGQILDEQLSTFDQTRKFFEEQGAAFAKGWDTLRHSIANATGENADNLFREVKESGKIQTKLEGKMLEEYRNMALKVSKGAPKEMPGTQRALGEFMTDLGYGLENVRDNITYQMKEVMRGPSVKTLKERFPDASEKTLANFDRLLRNTEQKIRAGGGKLPLAETDFLYKRMRSFIDDNIGTKNSRVAESMINLKNELRDDWAMHIGNELQNAKTFTGTGGKQFTLTDAVDTNAFENYQKSMAKYSDMLKAQDALGNALKKNDMSSAAFADYLFSPTQGKDRVKQMKTLITELTPELWDKLRSAKLNNITQGAIQRVKGSGSQMSEVIDFGHIRKEISKLEKAGVADELFDGGKMGREQFEKFMTLAERVDSKIRINPDSIGSGETVGALRKMLIVATPGTSMTAKIANVATLVGGMGKDKAMAKWLNGEGLELVLKGIPKPKRSAARAFLNEAIKQGIETETRMGIADPNEAYQDIPAGGM